MLKDFQIHPTSAWGATCPFGGGWEAGKDPASRGWRVRAISHECAILARKGEGSAWLVQMLGGHLHLAQYDLPPHELERLVKSRSPLPEMQRTATSAPTSGWALKFIDL